MHDPFYQPLDATPAGIGGYRATRSTVGPWYDDAQHGGPPSALLVRALERCDDRPGTQLSRITVDVLGPVPDGEVRVTAAVERPGRSISLSVAEMTAGGRPVLRARAWRLAGHDTTAVARSTVPPLPGPDSGVEMSVPPTGWVRGFIDATEWRWLEGGLDELGPGSGWIRQRVPLVGAEEASPLQRLVVAADCGNGIAASLDIREWLFVNTELTIHLHRAPMGEWMGVDAHTVIGPTGLGTVSSLLFDEQGHVGRAAQGLVVRPR